MPARKRPADRAASPRSAASHPLAAAVRRRRLALGLTIDAAAEACSLESRHLQAIETGATNVTLATLVSLARGLDVDIGALLASVPAGVPAASVRAPVPSRSGPEAFERALGERVSTMRLGQGWSQRDLAERAGISLGLVQSVERASKSATVRSVVLLAEALGVAPAILLDAPTGPRRGRSRPRAPRRAQ